MDKFRDLSRMFTTGFLKEMALNHQSPLLEKLQPKYKFISNAVYNEEFRNLFNKSYRLLVDNYRCEYIYKTELYSKIRQENKKLKNWGILTEVKAENSIADLVWLNGKSTAYEIKTEIDTNKRLSKQLNSYHKLFEKTCLVTYESNIEKAKNEIPEVTGILVLKEDRTIEEYRAPKPCIDNYDHEAMFNTLRKSEYTAMIKNIYGYVPEVPNTKIYEVCLEMFKNIHVVEAQDQMKEQLKQRAQNVNNSSRSFPKSMKLLIESGNYKKSEIQSITQLVT